MKPKRQNKVAQKGRVNLGSKNKKSKNLSKSSKNKRNKGRVITSSGHDFVRTIEVFPDSALDGDIRLVTSYDISPSSFPNTRLELLSNTYQMYRFNKLEITFSSLLPTAINGLFMAYIDTDPADDSIEKVSNSTDLLRIARSHQGSKQGKIRDNWKVIMPQRRDDQFFFIGNDGNDERLRKMGKLYIYQIGQATKFDGSPLEEELVAGALNINWNCSFMNPQLQALTRVYDGVSEKDVNRLISNIDWYRSFSKTTAATNWLPGSRFRHETIIITPDFFTSTGDFVILQQPLQISLCNTVKTINVFAREYTSDNKYQRTLHDEYVGGKLTMANFVGFAEKAFSLLNGGVKVVGKIYDVIQLLSPIFLASQPLGAQVDAQIMIGDGTYAPGNQALPVGQMIVHNDGINPVKIEYMIEYLDAAHAADPTTVANLTQLLTAFKIVRGSTSGQSEIVHPKLPNLKLS